ncbi:MULTISPECIES: bifunctional phosphopantothenoylcysteine decarboxylase/phosphopantothenate--cysteine ligase CoaBC [Microbacterium]|uniref:bifunctional phosphopantothenoylcysteine decarboxylase/phosphopantothenate--cysteine ligase CoaBC n=1 Tax=Microbacterium TaxID=33882 RepID=UPI00217CCE20|nr:MULTISPECIES: bifunctional phosphopantothenoylcysteine decarboxylase/phosphopantothenate--cysteine ligase CoaBC [Microbacterium]UWF77416.1 bifunctional phosphopantothenoylcysteine decarboxylase/phosphopantothenate--cysteine ligase CoaBC [Microbacterium neungamense]WCM55578.1 bifunctional phosphopantothenoylcysteine decarboxylase/phosphopantothenate--cysteine ligase CoaBC [Microbacterium sp. EF45047]
MNIVVGVTGGIAAYKTVHLVRLLIKNGHEVTVIPTEDALRFVGAPTWESISRNTVTTSVHEDVARVRHVALGQAADLVIVAPATANTIAAMAAGLADDLLGTTLLATTAPVIIAPAMHTEMWRHPATQANIATLRERGVRIAGPADGELTGGDSGPGRMLEPEEILVEALSALAPQDLAGLRVAVSAGGTREPIDPVRFLGNRSSGRQGVALAVEAASRGAEVELVAAHIAADVLAEARRPGIRITDAGTAARMADAMKSAAARSDVIVMAAAVADYRPARASDQKLTKEDGRLERIELVENEDIVAGLAAARREGRMPEGQTIVAFAAETLTDPGERRARARRKRESKGVDLLAVNLVDAERGFEAADNAVEIIGDGGEVVASAAGTKREVAAAIWDAVNLSRHNSSLTAKASPGGAE